MSPRNRSATGSGCGGASAAGPRCERRNTPTVSGRSLSSVPWISICTARPQLRFAPAGFEADFFIPLEHIASVSQHGPAPQAREESGSKPVLLADRPLEGVTVLLVEDNILIDLEAEQMLTDLGARLVISASTLRAAEEAISANEFGFAMLDISVGRETSFDLARRLRSAGMPYMFASGYGDQVALDSDHSASVIIQKPYERDHLRRAIQLVIRDRLAAI